MASGSACRYFWLASALQPAAQAAMLAPGLAAEDRF